MRPRISIRGLVRPSVGWLVGRSVRPSVRQSVTLLSKLMKNGLLRILNDLGAGLGRKREEEDGGTRRKEGQRGKKDKEE